jgi:hypothetical protein
MEIKCVGGTLQADLGIPPLVFYQMKQPACSHFRLTNSHKHSISGQIYAFRTHNLRHLQQSDLENRIIRGCKPVFSEWSPSKPLPQPKYLERVLITNREKSFGRSLHVPLSNFWRLQVRPQPPPTEPTRHTSYLDIAGSDIDRPDLFKPAPYLLADSQISPKCLFPIRTQHTKEIPTHHHLRRHTNGRLFHSNYADRICPFCHSTPVIGNEIHYLLACPNISPVMEPMYTPLKKHLKRLALPPWEELRDTSKMPLLLRSSLPPQMDKRKAMREQWRICTGNYCALVALKLSSIHFSSPTIERAN